eukprot:5083219-Amphidinium_carterae.1
MLENLWQVLPPTPLSNAFEELESDGAPDAQHDLSPHTLAQHVIFEPRARGEVPHHLRHAESRSSGDTLSPNPQVRSDEALVAQNNQAASAALTLDYQETCAASTAMQSCSAAGPCFPEQGDIDGTSMSSRGAVVPSDDEATPYNRWNSISNTSTSVLLRRARVVFSLRNWSNSCFEQASSAKEGTCRVHALLRVLPVGDALLVEGCNPLEGELGCL